MSKRGGEREREGGRNLQSLFAGHTRDTKPRFIPNPRAPGDLINIDLVRLVRFNVSTPLRFILMID